MFAKYLLVLLAALAAGKGCASSSDVTRQPAKSPRPQTAAEQQKLDEILTRWEQTTAGTESFRYEFRRWEYDPVFGPTNTFKTYSEGIIEISMPDKMPDKWYFRTDKVLEYQEASDPEARPSYIDSDDQREEWSKDDTWLSFADRYRQTIVRTEIPPDSRRELTWRSFWPFIYRNDDSENSHKATRGFTNVRTLRSRKCSRERVGPSKTAPGINIPE